PGSVLFANDAVLLAGGRRLRWRRDAASADPDPWQWRGLWLLEALQELEERGAAVSAKVRSVGVPRVAVAWQAGVQKKGSVRSRLAFVPKPLGIVVPAPDEEGLWSHARGLQKVVQRW